MANLNNQNQSQTPRKKKKGGIGWLIFLLIIWAVNRLDVEKVQRFFSRLQWRVRTGNFRLDDTAIGVIAAVVLVIVLAVTISRVKKVRAARRFDGVKARGGGTAAAHSHDRLQGYRAGAAARPRPTRTTVCRATAATRTRPSTGKSSSTVSSRPASSTARSTARCSSAGDGSW